MVSRTRPAVGSSPALGSGLAEESRRTGQRGYMLGAISFAVLAGVLPAIFVSWGAHEAATGLNIFLAWCLVLISSARLAQAIGTGQVNLLVITFHVFVYVFFGLAGLAQLLVGTYPLDGLRYQPGTVKEALALILLGVIAYEIGCWLVPSRSRLKGVARPVACWSFSQPRVRTLGVFGLSVVAVLVARAGLSPFFTSRDAASAAIAGPTSVGVQLYNLQDKTSYVLLDRAGKVPVFVALFAILFMMHKGAWRNKTPSGKLLDRLLAVALLVANVIVSNPFANAREWFGTVGIAFLSIYLPFDGLRGKRVMVAGSVLTLLFAFTSLDAFRRTEPIDGSSVNPRTDIVSDGSYSAFQTVLNGVEYVERDGYAGGKQLAGAVFAILPRSIWADKPIDTGSLIDPTYNRSSTLWTEAQVDFGLPGVAVLFVLYGFGSTRLEKAFRARSGALRAIIPILAGFQIFFLRGSLIPVMGTLYPLAFLLLVVMTRESSGTRLGVNAKPPSRGDCMKPDS